MASPGSRPGAKSARDAGADAYITGASKGRAHAIAPRRALQRRLGRDPILRQAGRAGCPEHLRHGRPDPQTSPAGFSTAHRTCLRTEIEQASTSNLEAYRHYELGTDYARRFLDAEAIRETSKRRSVWTRNSRLPTCVSDQYFLQGDQRRVNEITIKVEQMQSHLPHSAVVLGGAQSDRSRDLEAVVLALQGVIANSSSQRRPSHYSRDSPNLGSSGRRTALRYAVKDSRWIPRMRMCSMLSPTTRLSQAILAVHSRPATITWPCAPGDPNPVDSRGRYSLYGGSRRRSSRLLHDENMKPDFNDYGEYLKLAIV